MSIGFIGCGNMAGAIIKGIIKAGAVNANEIYAYDKDSAKTAALSEETGINICENANEIVSACDYTVLAVKPNVLAGVLDGINLKTQEKETVLVSIAAGKSIDFIRNSLSHNNKIIRVMPNINAMAGSACSAYCANEYVSDSNKAFIEKIFGAVGQISEISENYFPLFGVVAGCSPAFSYMFIDEIARAAVKNGMPKNMALSFAAQTVLGSAKLILESEEQPYQLVDKVCSPGGTTIEGVLALQENGFANAVHKAVQAAFEKDKKL